MSDLEQQIQLEQKRLYESASLTDEMADGTAQELLEWASAQVPKIAGDGTKLEDRGTKLRRLVKEMSYLVGNAENLEPQEMGQEFERVYQAADDLSYPIRRDTMPALMREFDGINAGDVLVILIAWLENDSLLNDVLDANSDDNQNSD